MHALKTRDQFIEFPHISHSVPAIAACTDYQKDITIFKSRLSMLEKGLYNPTIVETFERKASFRC